MKDHHEFTGNDVATLIGALSPDGAKAIINNRKTVEVKYGQRTLGWLEAGINAVGEDNIVRLLAGDVTVEFTEVIKALIDRHGRRRTDGLGLKSAVCDANWDFKLKHPTFDFGALAESNQRHFQGGLEFPSASELEDKGMAAIEWLKGQEQLSNLLKGPHFILGLPKMKVKDYGQVLEDVFLAAVASSYQTRFPERQFINHRQGTLKGQVEVVNESRNKLHTLMRKQKVVVVWFPAALQGFSINADREQMTTLPYPDKLWLGGAFEACTGIVGYPGTIARDFHAPGLDLAANSWGSAGYSLYFRARGDGLGFGGTGRLAGASGYYSGSLVLLA